MQESLKKIYLGCHVSMTKPNYLLGSATLAHNYGATTFMIYTGAPQNSIRTPLSELKISEFQKYCNDQNFNLDKIVVHAPYILNVGTNDPYRHAISTKTLLQEAYRTQQIGLKLLVFHPGNNTNCSKEVAIDNIAKALNEIHKKIDNVIICLETMAGKGTEIGGNFLEISEIIKKVNNKNLIGVCLDTCHLNDAGYDVSNIDHILNEFDKIIGLKYLKVVHLNDSKNVINSHKDRHENIGYGKIGFDTLLKYVHHPKLSDLPKILETPFLENGNAPYSDEIKILLNQKWFDFKKTSSY